METTPMLSPVVQPELLNDAHLRRAGAIGATKREGYAAAPSSLPKSANRLPSSASRFSSGAGRQISPC